MSGIGRCRLRGGRHLLRDRGKIAVTSSEDVEESKPAADLLQVTLNRMGGVRTAVLVGDTPYDVESASRAGLPCVAVLTGGFAAAELREAGAAAVTDSVADLVDVDWGRLLA